MSTRKLLPLVLFLLVIISCNKKNAETLPGDAAADISNLRYTGTVIDAVDKKPIPGVAVFRKYTNTGTVTDADGKFTYTSTVYDNFTMVFSMTGYQMLEMAVGSGGQNLGSIELVPEP